ncbi:MAG TPA: ketoacyl-ACP synthase III [Candidatus Blautia stercoravium]|nr:ketoacyl-ACP synthase III [Candidatus Blautia stercoravium]
MAEQRTGRITGTGSCVPDLCITNERLSEVVDTSDAWIYSRTGIHRRRIAADETVADLAAEAAKSAMEKAKILPEEIDLLLVATCSGEMLFPGTACQVQARIGAVRAAAFDMNAACSGFLFALGTAWAYLKSGLYEKILVIGAEKLSRLLDWGDRSTCVLFGDGAGAVVLEADGKGIMGMVQHADGNKGQVLTCPEGHETAGSSNPFLRKTERIPNISSLEMEGQEVFKFAVKQVPRCIEEVLAQTGTAKEEIRYYILHQANSRILSGAAKRLQEPEGKFPMNMEEYGNTSAASIPLLLDELNREGKLQRGDKLVLSGFGAGLTWGALLLEW